MRPDSNSVLVLPLVCLLGGCGSIEAAPPACEDGLIECGGACVDPMSDETFCGAGVDCVIDPGTTCDEDQTCVAGGCENISPPLSEAVYQPVRMFTDVTGVGVTVGLAFDGTSFWSASGGNVTGERLSRYDREGVFVESFAPGVDFRSVFTRVPNRAPVLARAFQSDQVLVQTSPGVFASQITLTGAALDNQSTLVFDSTRNEFVAQTNGVVQRWDEAGAFLGTVELQDWGIAVPGEDTPDPDGQRVTTAGGLFLTYRNGTLSAFDITGTRIGTTQLAGAGQSLVAHLSLSFADGLVWIVDDSNGIWRGYDVGL